MRNRKSSKLLPGLLAMGVGLYLYAAGLGIIQGKAHVPLWVICLVGLLFFSAGVSMVFDKYFKKNRLLTSFILMLFSLIALGVGFYSSDELTAKIVGGSNSILFLVLSIKVFTTNSDKE